MNDLGFAVQMNWIDYKGKAVPYTEVPPGGNWSQNTNTEHPWLVRKVTDQSEVACFCCTGGEVKLSDTVNEAQVEKETKAGYLAADGDFATGVTQEEAERICRTNPGKTMGYCFKNSNSDYCWVKVPGTKFCANDGWTTVTFSAQQDSTSRSRRRANQGRHNDQQERHNDQQPAIPADCTWSESGESITCRAMNQTFDAYEFEGFKVCCNNRANTRSTVHYIHTH